MKSLSLIAIIITKNEARHVVACIDSLRGWVDAVVVWDSGSDDDTQRLAQEAGALVVERPFDNFAAQRQAALDSLNGDWILFLDADERATPPFAQEVQAVVARSQNPVNDGAPVGYWLPRRNFIVGDEIQHSGYYPDYQLRLLWRRAANYVAEREVHETVALNGAEAHLQEPVLHHNYANWAQFHRKQRFYAAYEARILAARGIHPRPHNFVLQPLREFRRRFISLAGWRDGVAGLRLALLFAWYYGFVPYWILLTRREL